MKLQSKLSLPVALVAGVLIAGPSSACLTAVGWIADMAKPGAKYSASLGERGTAEMQFDWLKPFGTITIKTHNVRGVRSIILRRVTAKGGLNGPVVARLYDSSQGAYTGTFSKLLRESDIVDVKPSERSDLGIADAMLHRGIAVAVCTAAHPDGEIAGVITAHRIVTYSRVAGGFHDPKLHSSSGL